jgi:Flp pilus assembly CpaE family ATPase
VNVAALTAISDPRREAEIAAGLHTADLGVTVVRRCVDLADLLAAGASGLAQAAVVSADLPRLNREAVMRLQSGGVVVLALAPDDAGDRDRLRRLGVSRLISESSTPDAVASAVVSAVRDGDFAGVDDGIVAGEPAHPQPRAGGRLIAVWGPVGAPGRSTLALNCAAELAALGHEVLCVDLDTYGASLAQHAGVLDDASGVAAACRRANNGGLDTSVLRSLAVRVAPRLSLLTGIGSPHRWPELRPAALELMLQTCREAFPLTVVDVGFCLEHDEELMYDTVAPRRNGAALTALEVADAVVAVAAADPVGIARFARSVADLRRGLDRPFVTVVNRVRRTPLRQGSASDQLSAALERYAAVDDPLMVPDDPVTADAAVAAGRTWAEVAPASPARAAVRRLAAQLCGAPEPTARGRGLAAFVRR